MPTVQETATGATPLSSALGAGIANISYGDEVTFTKYIRLVLPIDGFVFWCRAAIVVPGSDAYNSHVYNKTLTNEGGAIDTAATSLIAKGSLHATTTENQNEADSAALNSMIFTTQTEIIDLNVSNPNTMWVAEYDGVKYAFRESFKFYAQAGVYHYRGQALLSMLDTQLIDAPGDINLNAEIVSNSLPIWLALNAKATVYPSFAVPTNLPPPYITAHVEPTQTRALQAAPLIDINGSHWQLSRDTVKFTLYGLTNNAALDFQDYLFDASLVDDAPFGVMNMPVMQDEKVPQPEYQILAQKKTFSLEVSYYQTRMQQIVRQMILSAFIDITVADIAVTI